MVPLCVMNTQHFRPPSTCGFNPTDARRTLLHPCRPPSPTVSTPLQPTALTFLKIARGRTIDCRMRSLAGPLEEDGLLETCFCRGQYVRADTRDLKMLSAYVYTQWVYEFSRVSKWADFTWLPSCDCPTPAIRLSLRSRRILCPRWSLRYHND